MKVVLWGGCVLLYVFVYVWWGGVVARGGCFLRWSGIGVFWGGGGGVGATQIFFSAIP